MRGPHSLHRAEVPTSRVVARLRMSAFVEGQQRGSKTSRTRPHDTPLNSTTTSVQCVAMQGLVVDDLLGSLDGMQGVRGSNPCSRTTGQSHNPAPFGIGLD